MLKVISAVAVAAAVVLAGSAAAAAKPTRIRGEIQSIRGHELAIRSYSGSTVDLTLTGRTHYTSVVPAKLSDIRHRDFVGIGATGPKNHLAAMEVVIFPASMRGTGEGHYPWSVPATVAKADLHRGGSAAPGGPPVHGSMTNGTVVGTAGGTAGPPVHGTMTNGTVAGSSTRGGGKELVVSYNKGQKVRIFVRPQTPVVRLIPTRESVLRRGAKVFAIAVRPKGSERLAAAAVAVGKDGLMPPM